MNRFELIETVRELNYTATLEFLSQFTEDQLQEYIDHLLEVKQTQSARITPDVTLN